MNKRHFGNDCEEAETINPIFTLKGHINDVTCIDFSGRNLLATGSSYVAYILQISKILIL